jgi:Holliday junction resolvase-like predicted endonuclease
MRLHYEISEHHPGGGRGMNKVKKGYRVEKRCADELKAQGYHIWKTVRVKFQDLDLWGCFDVAALHPQGEHILFVQCKSERVDNEMRDKIRALKMPSGCVKQIWIWRARRGWIKELYT